MSSLFFSIPYLLLLFLLVLSVFKLCPNGSISENTQQNEYWDFIVYFFLFCTLSLFYAFRGYIGVDWIAYKKAYDISPTMFEESRVINFLKTNGWEKGFLLLIVLAKSLSLSFLSFQGISSFINIAAYFFIFKKLSKSFNCSKFLVLLCFFVFQGGVQEFDLMRNTKALLFFLFSIKYLINKDFKKYTLLNIIGMLFHISSILYIPLYFLVNKKINKKIVFSIWLIGNILYFLHYDLISLFLPFISVFSPKRLSYLIKFYLENSAFGNLGFGFSFIEKNVVFILLLKKKAEIESTKTGVVLFNSMVIVFILTFYFRNISIIATRIANLFIFSYWFIIPIYYKKLSKDNKKVFLFIFFIFCCLKIIHMYSPIKMSYETRLNIWGYSDEITRKYMLYRNYPELKLMMGD